MLVHAGGGMGKTALAREATHWWRRTGRSDLALFHSFEPVVLAFAELAEADWAGLRAELVATALLRVDDVGIQIDNTPI